MIFYTLLRSAISLSSSFFVLLDKLVILKFHSVSILLFLSLSLPQLSLAQQTSALWGQHGELWSPQSRLPDFSFAGYHMGEDPIPDIPVKTNVRNFGARGDGVTDDTQAFLNAINNTSNGALFVPAGRYRITQRLIINKSNFVLKGEGPDRTTLYFPRSLYDMVGPGTSGSWSGWSWSGGVISIEGNDNGASLASVVAPALRGDTILTLSSTSNISAGQAIRLTLSEDGSGTLMANILHQGGTFNKSRLDFVSRVASVEGNNVVLERPLRTDVQLSWQPKIFAHSPTVKEAGIESLTIEFPNVPYKGHLEEAGYNAILLLSVSHCWVRDVTIHNADSGVFLERGTRFSTIEGLRLTGREGHHGVEVDGLSESNLITRFEFNNTFVHDITVQYLVHGNVFSNGSGVDINFDHHRAAPFENLFSNIDIGRGSRPYESSGDSGWGGNNSAARETFWNIYKSDGTVLTKAPSWPEVNIIGGSHPEDLFPADIHQAQLAVRLNDGTTPLPQSPSAPPAVPSPSSTIVVSSTSVVAGGNVTVTVSNGPRNRADWVGLYSASAPAENGKWTNLLSWQYLNGREIPPSTGNSSATLSFGLSVTPGTYQFRFFANDGFALLATSPNVIVTPIITSSRATSLINSATVMAHSKNFASDHPVEHLWDGCLEGTPACTAGAGNISSFWIDFDLGKLHDLTSARLFGDADGNWLSTSWTLEYKQNIGDPWTGAFNSNAFFNGWSIQPLETTARYIRVQVFGNQKQRATQARELEIYGTPR